MSGRFFLDTNIFVYTFDRDAPAKANAALELVREGISTRKGMVSYQVVQQFFSVALGRFASPLSLPEAEHYFATTFRPLLAVNSSPVLFLNALRVKDTYRFSWYDSLIVSAALQGECELLYSEDLQSEQKVQNLRIQNPFR